MPCDAVNWEWARVECEITDMLKNIIVYFMHGYIRIVLTAAPCEMI